MSDGGLDAMATMNPLIPSHVTGRLIAGALLRSAGVVAATLVVYALIPIREETALAIGVIAGVGMVILAVIFIGQLRRISAASSPMAAAAEALALVFGMFLALFAFVYASLDALSPDSFSQPVNKVAAVYFSVTVLATVGFGDIAAVTDTARVLVTVQMVLDLLLIGAAVKLLGASARKAVDARLEAAGPAMGTGDTRPPPGLDTLPDQADEDRGGRT